MYQDSVFLFSIEASIQDIAEYEAVTAIGDYQLKHSKNTPVAVFNCEGRELLIYGYAVDIHDGTYENIGEKILSKSKTINDILACEAQLGGKYLLLYSDASGMYAVPDATASVPFCYTTEEFPLVCAHDSEYIAKKMQFAPDVKRLKIRKLENPSQAMPYNITVYREIEHLLPNHYYSFAERKMVRFVNFAEGKTPITPRAAAIQTAPMIKNLLKYYERHFKLYCPITSGWDSRVVLSFMHSLGGNAETYTIKHNDFSDGEADIVIPKRISEALPVKHTLLNDTEPSAQLYQMFDEAFGETGYSRRTLMLANTIKNAYGDGAILNGDIMGQVGKCSLHRDISERFATARYFRCKLHNYSNVCIDYIEKWLKDIKESKEKVNLFDLFSLESRMGRWAAQENLIYAMKGQIYLNIFNSRAIIYPWTRVPRKDRKYSKIHQELMALTCPELMQIPVGGKTSVVEKITKWNGLTYYLASFVKYYVERFCFLYK